MNAPRTPPPFALPRPPSEEESARAAIEPFIGMSVDERLRAQTALVRALLAFAGDRPILRDDDYDPLWPHWKDPCFGR